MPLSKGPSKDFSHPNKQENLWEDDFSGAKTHLDWKFCYNSDPVVEENPVFSQGNGFALKVGARSGYDTAFVNRSGALHHVVSARLLVPERESSSGGEIGIFARAQSGDIKDRDNCCFILGANSRTGELKAVRRKEGYEWPLKSVGESASQILPGWHEFRISAIDQLVTAFVDGEVVANARTNVCLGGTIGGVYAGDLTNKQRRLCHGLVDQFTFELVPADIPRLGQVLCRVDPGNRRIACWPSDLPFCPGGKGAWCAGGDGGRRAERGAHPAHRRPG